MNPTKLGKKDFLTLKDSPFRYKGRFFIFLFAPSEESRVGFIVSRRHGGAVQRNLQKRWIRTFLRESGSFRDVLKERKILIIALPYKGLYASKREDFFWCLKKIRTMYPI